MFYLGWILYLMRGIDENTNYVFYYRKFLMFYYKYFFESINKLFFLIFFRVFESF